MRLRYGYKVLIFVPNFKRIAQNEKRYYTFTTYTLFTFFLVMCGWYSLYTLTAYRECNNRANVELFAPNISDC
jgi:hypothetical protein